MSVGVSGSACLVHSISFTSSTDRPWCCLFQPALTAIKENGFHNAQLLERAKFEEGASIEVLREEVTDTEEEISRIEKQYKASGEEYECRKRVSTLQTHLASLLAFRVIYLAVEDSEDGGEAEFTSVTSPGINERS